MTLDSGLGAHFPAVTALIVLAAAPVNLPLVSESTVLRGEGLLTVLALVLYSLKWKKFKFWGFFIDRLKNIRYINVRHIKYKK